MNDALQREVRVKLMIPGHDKEPMKSRIRHSKLHGEHLAFHGKEGVLLSGAGNGGAWVQFDGTTQYVGCPIAWLQEV